MDRLDKLLDFARVQWNTSLLFVLLILFFHWHVPDIYIGGVFGAMIQAMQTQRFSWPKVTPPAKVEPEPGSPVSLVHGA